MRSSTFFLPFLVFCIIGISYGKRILIFNPVFAYSHFKFISKMADIIADHGHEVTLFQPRYGVLKNGKGLTTNKNIEVIDWYPNNYEELKTSTVRTFPEFWDSQLMNNPILSAFMMPRVLSNEFQNTATQIFMDSKLHEEFKLKNFDVAIAETFEISGFYISHILGIPCIPIMSGVRIPVYNELFGQPSTLGFIPQIGSKMAPEAGFLDRLNDAYRNFFGTMAFDTMAQLQNNYLEKAIGRSLPNWRGLMTQSPIYITNSNPYLDFAIPTTATIVHVGGITMDLKKLKDVPTLPEEYEKILQERESTVLISFGSVIRSFEMPDKFKAGMIKMFESLPDVTFIWKYEKEDDEFQKKLPKNVHLKKWVPQPALLSDNRLKVFMTHGGLGSIMEVAYTGKPALAVPIFGDQPQNAYMLERHGGAIAYDKFNLKDGEKLTKVMKDLVTNPDYVSNAKELQEILFNQPIDPKLNLMKHLEFAMEFPNLRSQVPDISKSGLVAHYYLDVLGFLSLATIITSYLSVQLIKKIYVILSARKTKND